MGLLLLCLPPLNSRLVVYLLASGAFLEHGALGDRVGDLEVTERRVDIGRVFLLRSTVFLYTWNFNMNAATIALFTLDA